MAIAQAAPMTERAAVDRRFALLWRTQEAGTEHNIMLCSVPAFIACHI